MKILNDIFKQRIDYDSPISKNIYFGMGCFWGAEKLFWNIKGVIVTAVGYSAGFTENPVYEDVCSGNTNHAEVVKVVYDPKKIKLSSLLKIFWEGHNPTQGMRQGNDFGTQYRSIIITNDKEQYDESEKTKQEYEIKLLKNGFPKITTKIERFKNFYYAEKYHQQYLSKNPNGYCGLSGCNVNL